VSFEIAFLSYGAAALLSIIYRDAAGKIAEFGKIIDNSREP
jgi:hypothetical protein